MLPIIFEVCAAVIAISFTSLIAFYAFFIIFCFVKDFFEGDIN